MNPKNYRFALAHFIARIQTATSYFSPAANRRWHMLLAAGCKDSQHTQTHTHNESQQLTARRTLCMHTTRTNHDCPKGPLNKLLHSALCFLGGLVSLNGHIPLYLYTQNKRIQEILQCSLERISFFSLRGSLKTTWQPLFRTYWQPGYQQILTHP